MYSINIKKLWKKQTETHDDFVESVEFTYTKEEDGIRVSVDTYLAFPTDSTYNTSFNELTEEEVLSWIESNTELVDRLKLTTDRMMESEKNVSVESTVPWAE